MSIDAESIRRLIREDREEAERKAADKAERDDLKSRLEKLEAKGTAKPDKKDEDDAPDHQFEA